MSQNLLAEFCLRLASGLACMMVFTSSRAVGVQFYRTIMLLVLGLSVVGLLFGSWPMRIAGLMYLPSAVLTFVGFIVWTLGRVTAGRLITVSLFFCTSIAMIVACASTKMSGWLERLIGAGELVTSALLLGSMMTAMLLGHSYLIAPTMSIEPLKRLVIWIGVSVVGRAVFAGLSLMVSNQDGTITALDDSWWWSLFTARWVVGLVGPAVIAWMVWQTARIRATQAATGILYAGVILTFFGELVSQLLNNHTGAAS